MRKTMHACNGPWGGGGRHVLKMAIATTLSQTGGGGGGGGEDTCSFLALTTSSHLPCTPIHPARTATIENKTCEAYFACAFVVYNVSAGDRLTSAIITACWHYTDAPALLQEGCDDSDLLTCYSVLM